MRIYGSCAYTVDAHIQNMDIYEKYAYILRICTISVYAQFLYMEFAHLRCRYMNEVHIWKICTYRKVRDIRNTCAYLPYMPSFRICACLLYIPSFRICAISSVYAQFLLYMRNIFCICPFSVYAHIFCICPVSVYP